MGMKVREQIKTLLVAENITMRELAKMLSEALGKDYSLGNLSAKLIRGTLSYNEVLTISELLDYEIKFIKKT